MKFSRRRTQARQAHRDLRLPAMFQQILRVRSEAKRFLLPAAKAEQRTDPHPAESRVVPALRAIEPPVEIAFRSRRVQLGVGLAVVGLLVNHETFRTRIDNRDIIRRLHRPDLDRDRRELRRQRPDAIREIILADEFRMFARDEENLPEAFLRQVPALGDHLLDAERHAQDRIVAGKTAVAAIVDALVRKIERREEPHRPPEILQRQRVRLLRQCFQLRIRLRGNQRLESPEKRRFLQRQIIQGLRE